MVEERVVACRMHGGVSIGPRLPDGLDRSRRANWKHGRYSAEAMATRTPCRGLLSVPLQRESSEIITIGSESVTAMAAAPPRPVMNSRLFTRSPRRRATGTPAE
jgi:hypothetical protein